MTDTENAHGTEGLPAKPTPLFVMQKTKFNFKKPDEISGQKRPPVEVELPYPTWDGLLNFLSVEGPAGEKNQKFILDLLGDVVKEQARGQVIDESKPVNKQEELNLDKLDLTFIANLPPSERKMTKIEDAVWKEFSEVYVAVMPALTGKSTEAVDNAVFLFSKKLNPCKTRKDVLNKLKPQLAAFWGGITDEQRETFADIYEFLDAKITTYLSSDELEKAMENL